MSVSDLAAAALAVRGHLSQRLTGRSSPLVAAYEPVGTEPGGTELAAFLTAAGARVLLPVVLPSMDLDWAPYTGPASVARTGRGLLEPSSGRVGPAAIADCDLVIVPALAVDRRGNRLGRGAGCYDRALARVPAGVPLVALLHDGELTGPLPAEPHDIPMTAVVTPSGGWCDL